MKVNMEILELSAKIGHYLMSSLARKDNPFFTADVQQATYNAMTATEITPQLFREMVEGYLKQGAQTEELVTIIAAYSFCMGRDYQRRNPDV